MVETQIRARGVTDPRVLAAMATVPRERFLPEEARHLAYGDYPLDIGCGQTMSQPYIVAYMSAALATAPGDRVLEIGAGCGYQTAVLAALGVEVFAIEIVATHAAAAAARLAALGYRHAQVRHGDGYDGWPDAAPFDAALVAAAPDHVPPALLEQVRLGGRLVLPVGRDDQVLLTLVRTTSGWDELDRLPVRFVPLTRTIREDV